MKKASRKNMSDLHGKDRLKQLSILVVVLLCGAFGLWVTFGTYAGPSDTPSGIPFQIISAPATKKGATVTVPLALKNIPPGGPYYIAIFAELLGDDDGSGNHGRAPFSRCTIANCKLNPVDTVGVTKAGVSACFTINNASSLHKIGNISYTIPNNKTMYRLQLTAQRFSSLNDCSGLRTPAVDQSAISYSDQIFFLRNNDIPNAATTPIDSHQGSYCYEPEMLPGGGYHTYYKCEGFIDTPSPNPKPDSNDGGGAGDNGNGNGGWGSGTGNNGSGTGKKGTGSSGGGLSATKQGNTKKPTPKPTPQGTKEADPPQQEPSPFFDGKQYTIGSDPDAQTPVDLVKNPSKALVNIWFYPLAAIVAAGLGAGAWFGWKSISKKRRTKK